MLCVRLYICSCSGISEAAPPAGYKISFALMMSFVGKPKVVLPYSAASGQEYSRDMDLPKGSRLTESYLLSMVSLNLSARPRKFWDLITTSTWSLMYWGRPYA